MTELPKILARRKLQLGVQQLFDKIKCLQTVTFAKATDEGWGCIIQKDGVVRIDWNTGDSIEPAFAHELLHIDLQLRGYERCVNAHEDCGMPFFLAIGALDNELQHHKIFPQFQALGLPPREFYGRHSRFVVPLLNKQLKKERMESAYDFIRVYSSACSVGGADKPEDMIAFRRYMRGQFPAYEHFADIVEREIQAWTSAETVDPRETLWNIFNAVPTTKRLIFGPGEINMRWLMIEPNDGPNAAPQPANNTPSSPTP